MIEEERVVTLPTGDTLTVTNPRTTDPCLLLWAREDTEWTRQLNGHFAVAVLESPVDRLEENIDRAKEALGEAGLTTVALVSVGEDSAVMSTVAQKNPLGLTALVLIAPEALDAGPYAVPVMVIADHETAGNTLSDSFEAIVAPEKAMFAIKGGEDRPMKTKPPIFLIALRQAVFRAMADRQGK